MGRAIALPRLVQMTAAERETIIRWDEEDRMVVVWAASAPVLRKLLRLGLTPTDTVLRAVDDRLHGMEFRIPLKQFRWGLKRKATRKGPVMLPKRAVGAISSTKQPEGGSTPVPTVKGS